MQTNKKFSLSFHQIAGSLLLLILTACTNWKEEPVISKVIIINALPKSNAVNLLFDGQALSFAPLSYGAFYEEYQNLRAGRRIVSATLSGNTTPIVTDTLFLAEFKNYTAILTQDIKKNPINDTIILYPDTLTEPASGKANVRLINMYPDTTASLDLLVNGSMDTLFLNRKFMAISRFIAVDILPEYTFILRNNSKPVSGLSWTLPVSRQNNYSILVTDTLITATGERKPNLKLITHQ